MRANLLSLDGKLIDTVEVDASAKWPESLSYGSQIFLYSGWGEYRITYPQRIYRENSTSFEKMYKNDGKQ